MKIYTDASLNDAKKTAGFSCICVSDDNQLLGQYGFAFSTKSVHFSELFAVRYAVLIAQREKVEEVKIFSDSAAVLKKLEDYMRCLSKTSATLSQHDRKFLSKLESDRVPFQKRILDDIVDMFEKNKNIKFNLFHVHGHQRPKGRLETEEDYNAYWNDYADKLADEIRQMGEIANGEDGKLLLLNDGTEHPVKLIGDKPISFENVNIISLAGMKEPQLNKKKENRIIRIACQARRTQGGFGSRGGRGRV